jgi:hypothetical protein
VIETIEAGKVTKDLAICQHGNKVGVGSHAVCSLPCTAQPHTDAWLLDPGEAAARAASTPTSPWTAPTTPTCRAFPLTQVTPDQYLNTEPFMDAVAATFAAKRAGSASADASAKAV